LFTSYQFAKFTVQINIGPGYKVVSVNGMCRSNVIIYQNEIKFEIYCNDKTESHHIYHRKKIESSDKHNNLGMDKVTHYTHCDFPGYIKCEKNIL
jgi:hypothetical protein